VTADDTDEGETAAGEERVKTTVCPSCGEPATDLCEACSERGFEPLVIVFQ
jgi:hypothetical protein